MCLEINLMDSNRCVFCEITRGNIKTRKIYETKHSIAILDAFPLKEGHSLIISKTHSPKIQDLSSEASNDIFNTLYFLTEKIEKAMDCSSSLISIHNGKDSGQEIPHFHIHIIPASYSNRNRSIHSLFDKKDIQTDKIDEYWKKISREVGSTQSI
ncbi:HIT domain protein [Candidatus Nitrosocosmicus franklandus]|uniref:HIT domain protein n=2 Tax=Candidatus Nitrosocosmicus franklandianus TaxID=1798806 RepID=A0A484IGP8_9ARCH|nr:HIT domain protein [Candidatus Nitrosocosmicus franklandus]